MILKEQREEYQNYLGVVVEDVRSSLKLIAEMVGKNTEDIDIMKTDLEFIKNGLKKKVDIDEFSALERRVAVLEKRR